MCSLLVSGGGGNPDRHKVSTHREMPPRPLGVAHGTTWEPHDPTRNYTSHTLTHSFLEALEAAPWLQNVAAAAMRVIAPILNRNQHGELPPDATDEPGAWNFAAIGDYGAGTPELRKIAENLARSSAELIITSGDNVYPSGRWQDYQKNWEPSFGAVARSRDFMPSLGNHDMYKDDLRPYFAHFPHLKGQAYYTFTKNDAQFFALDSDQDLRPGSAQLKWLEQQLANSKQPWKVVYLHYPMYGSDENAYPEIADSVQPLLEKYGVQLVVAGHEHNYLRAKPRNGVVHLLSGGGGQRVYPFMSKMSKHLARRLADHHHLEMSVGKTKMVVRAIDKNGTRIDTVEIPINAVAAARAGVRALAA
ncbi:MAG: metallophosphoesterase [Gaiellales bacterium]